MRDAHADDTGLAIRRMRGDGFCQVRAAGIGVAQSHHIEVAGGHAREKDGGFVGFRAGIGEKALLQIAGSDGRDFFGERDDVLIGIKRGRVLEAVHLRGHLAGDLGVAVADGDSEDAAKEIEVLVAVEIPDVLHRAAVGHQRLLEVVGHRGPEVFLVLGDDFVALRGARELGSGNELCWRGHGRVLVKLR